MFYSVFSRLFNNIQHILFDMITPDVPIASSSTKTYEKMVNEKSIMLKSINYFCQDGVISDLKVTILFLERNYEYSADHNMYSCKYKTLKVYQ